MWIQNISMAEAIKGLHQFQPHKTILIQIQDFDTWSFVPAKYHDEFKQVHQFKFNDIEDDDGTACTQEQAEELVKILQAAKENNDNIVVHCHAGICRSGAVVEVATMMGFDEPERRRIPNLLIKHKMMKVLGWTYDENEIRSDDPIKWIEFANHK